MKPELYSEQDVETKVIVPRLIELGYDEKYNPNVTLKFQHPITAQQGRERKTIFADIVIFVDDNPVIVVDSKNPRQFLSENDREQVISYARLIGNVAPYAALCNGHTWQTYDAVTKQQIKGIPTLKNLLGDIQNRRLSTRQRQNLVTQATRTLFAIESARELSRLMRRCHDVIRNLKGYDPTKAFDELSKLLFAKMYEEREIAENRRITNRFTLSTVKEMRKQGVEIIQTLWHDTVSSDQYKEVFSDQEAIAGIELPSEAIDEIVSILQDKSLGQTDLDIKGVAFEEFLAATYRGGGLGQFFTPREIVNFMVDLVAPAIGERIIDPACGTGGFLIRVYDVVSEKIRNSELSDQAKSDKLNELANTCIAGIDWEVRAARTCKMNMIIHGDGHAGVYQANSLDIKELEEKVKQRQIFYPDAPIIEEDSFDIILTNPPFGAIDRTSRILKSYELGQRKSQKREVLMLERCVRLLKPGGRMAVVVPEGILSNKMDKRIRDFIRKECIIKAIIRLPQDAFKMSEGAANTSILYLYKKDPEKPELIKQGDIFFARAEYIGISPSGKPIEQNDLLAIKEHYRQFELGGWEGIELKSLDKESMNIVRAAPSQNSGLWLEPEVNRTSLLYDRLSYVVRSPKIKNRFGYTYFHPKYFEIINSLKKLRVSVVSLEEICIDGYPVRGKKPSEDATDGISVLKVRNITGQGIDFESDYAPDTDDIRQECARALIKKFDVLMTSTGEGTIGRVDIYLPEDLAIADSHITICRLEPEINLRYIVEFLRSEYGQIQMLRHVSGSTGQTELLLDHVKNLRIPLPSNELQEQIVDLMEKEREKSSILLAKAQELRSEGANILAKARQQMMNLLRQIE